jgi:hypothetical protein
MDPKASDRHMRGTECPKSAPVVAMLSWRTDDRAQSRSNALNCRDYSQLSQPVTYRLAQAKLQRASHFEISTMRRNIRLFDNKSAELIGHQARTRVEREATQKGISRVQLAVQLPCSYVQLPCSPLPCLPSWEWYACTQAVPTPRARGQA